MVVHMYGSIILVSYILKAIEYYNKSDSCAMFSPRQAHYYRVSMIISDGKGF
jgi:hypothetical protein